MRGPGPRQQAQVRLMNVVQQRHSTERHDTSSIPQPLVSNTYPLYPLSLASTSARVMLGAHTTWVVPPGPGINAFSSRPPSCCSRCCMICAIHAQREVLANTTGNSYKQQRQWRPRGCRWQHQPQMAATQLALRCGWLWKNTTWSPSNSCFSLVGLMAPSAPRFGGMAAAAAGERRRRQRQAVATGLLPPGSRLFCHLARL